MTFGWIHRGSRNRIVLLVLSLVICAEINVRALHAAADPSPATGSTEVVTGAPGGDPVADAVAGVVKDPRFVSRTWVAGIDVVRLSDGARLFAQNHTSMLHPASTSKLFSTAAALKTLGPTYQFRTSVYGLLRDNAIEELVVVGTGDPSLRAADLEWLAARLRDLGVKRVARVTLDVSYFDDQPLPPAFEQQPNENSTFRSPVGALSVDRNTYELFARSGAVIDAPVSVAVWNPDYLVLTNSATTSKRQWPRLAVSQRTIAAQEGGTQGDAMEIQLTGDVPLFAAPMAIRGRIDDPDAYFATSFVRALRDNQIEVEQPPLVVHTAVPHGPLLARWHSDPLDRLVHLVGKWSNNYVIETIAKAVSAQAKAPGTSKDGIARMRAALTTMGITNSELTLVNASGLFEGNQTTPAAMTKLLRIAHFDPAISTEFEASLAVGGVDGTLRTRLRGLPASVRVRAKTGTLGRVIALSGYVLTGYNESSVAFSVIVNGADGQLGEARLFCDSVVRAVASVLATAGHGS